MATFRKGLFTKGLQNRLLQVKSDTILSGGLRQLPVRRAISGARVFPTLFSCRRHSREQGRRLNRWGIKNSLLCPPLFSCMNYIHFHPRPDKLFSIVGRPTQAVSSSSLTHLLLCEQIQYFD